MTKEEEIIKFARQLHDVAKLSNNWGVCVEKAVDEMVGNKIIAQYCARMGIVKKDYIDYLVQKVCERV